MLGLKMGRGGMKPQGLPTACYRYRSAMVQAAATITTPYPLQSWSTARQNGGKVLKGMRQMKRLVAAVAALSTVAGPTLALAQDHEHHDGGRWSGRQAQAQSAQVPAQAPAPQFRAPAQTAPQAAPQPQAQPRWQGGGGYRQQGGYQPQQAQPASRWQGQGYQGQNRWQGGAQPQVQAQPQAQAQPSYQPQNRYQGQGYQQGYRPQNQGQHDYRSQYQGQQAGQWQGNRGGYDREGGYRWGNDRDHRNEGGYRGGSRPGGSAFNWGGRSFYRYRAEPYRYPSGYGSWSNHGWRRGEFLPSFFFMQNYYISDFGAYGLWEPDYGLQWIRVGADALLINLATGEVVDVVPGVYYW